MTSSQVLSDNKLRMRNIRNHQIKGYPVTTQRQLLLKLLADACGHMNAKELYRRATNEDQSISLATVYRNLKLFKEMGLVEERHLGKFPCYEVRRSSEHQHLVCQVCGKVIEFDSRMMRRLRDEAEREHGFSITRAELCLEGYCPECLRQKE